MGSNRLRNNDTSPEVALCEWHLRKIFWDERLLTKLREKKLEARFGPVKPRKNPTVASPAPYNQEFVIFDPASNEEVARCHQLLESDMKTLAGSQHPDPKQIHINGIDYHQLGKQRPICQHCSQGISKDYKKIV
jgi:hypothetical protein